MSSQSYYQKAILSELGISSWQLQESSLLSDSIQAQEAQEAQEATPVLTSVNVANKLVFASESLFDSVPSWWLKDLLTALNLEDESVLTLKDNESADDPSSAILMLVSETESLCENEFVVTQSLSQEQVKKQLWEKVHHLFKDTSSTKDA